MLDVSIIALDLAKNMFQAHCAAADGSVVFRRKLTRSQMLKFSADHVAQGHQLVLARMFELAESAAEAARQRGRRARR